MKLTGKAKLESRLIGGFYVLLFIALMALINWVAPIWFLLGIQR